MCTFESIIGNIADLESVSVKSEQQEHENIPDKFSDGCDNSQSEECIKNDDAQQENDNGVVNDKDEGVGDIGDDGEGCYNGDDGERCYNGDDGEGCYNGDDGEGCYNGDDGGGQDDRPEDSERSEGGGSVEAKRLTVVTQFGELVSQHHAHGNKKFNDNFEVNYYSYVHIYMYMHIHIEY